METSTIHWIVFELILLPFCEFAPIGPFLARKLCHGVSGFMMLQLDPTDDLARWFVYAVAISSLLMIWELLPIRFRFTKPRDIGASIYLIVVVIFFYLQVPLHIIQPVFFADPMGAIVGKGLTSLRGFPNPAWIGKKTVGGTIAVFVVSYLTLTYGTLQHKILISLLIAFVEGITLEYDNLMITAVVIVGYNIVG